MKQRGEKEDSEVQDGNERGMEINRLYQIFKSCRGVATDSRKIGGGELFFALKGENFDGNAYAEKALEAGAAYAVVSGDSDIALKAGSEGGSGFLKDRIIPVADTLKTLQDLARWHRSMTFVNGKPIPVIGLTGTNGKTTTKELLKSVLSVRYRVAATEGNLNNSIGVPLTLLKIGSESEIAIVEMGASHPGDIRELVSVCLPNYGLITNVGKAHLLGFGSFEGVKKAKGELYDYIQRTADKVFLNVDNPDLRTMAAERPDLQTIPYGVEYQGAEILEADREHPYLRISLPGEGLEIDTNLIGGYNADNVMAALAVGRYFGIPYEEAAKAVSEYVPTNNRSQLLRSGSNTLIVDAYNANPTSMEAALANFDSMDAPAKAVMLGNMLELGEDSVAEHRKVIARLRDMKLDMVCLVGPEFEKAATQEDIAAGIRLFPDSAALADCLGQNPPRDCTVLIKGSRGSRMELLIPYLGTV